MSSAIELKDLSKRYGDRVAVDKLNLVIGHGDIFGFVGPNGAGKTTTIRMIAGLLQPTSGEISIVGYSVKNEPRQIRQIIGYMPDYFGVYPDLKVWEYLDFFCACYQIPEHTRNSLVTGLLELVDLTHRKEDIVDKLSRGMKQRLSLARTLLHDPQILLLDEPAANLDPRARVEIRELLVELSEMGKTVFFSTHILADVAEICSHVGIIEAGNLAACGDIQTLNFGLTFERKFEVAVLNRCEDALHILQSFKEISIKDSNLSNTNKNKRISFAFSGDDHELSQVLNHLITNDIPVIQFYETSRYLEEVFLSATKGIVT